jgi:hypothetical protein
VDNVLPTAFGPPWYWELLAARDLTEVHEATRKIRSMNPLKKVSGTKEIVKTVKGEG